MSGQSWIEATAEQRAELRGLAGSSEREEADRARAILLSLDGWTSERIAPAFCAQPDSVRHWRWIFGREGVAGSAAPHHPRPTAGRGTRAGSIGAGGCRREGLGARPEDPAWALLPARSARRA